ncbi:hypothetical protein CVD28_03155 [Bacillus sp. M6-12]|uniref:GNAT family N-acetyltransferase n=1 Tax=Bacillus sp. M6-12 TaxID=2054166 RepID=UPI000C75A3E0|nr:GNAT family N-acetyltransferase [Bacillus sp. M6-12]PLS19428.1 hypothetical protein CVD28_03155 [Bacillus sp. M6-12]
MLSIKPVFMTDIENTEYEQKSNLDAYMILKSNKPVAYVWFDIKDNTMDLGMIEVIEKGKGLGTEIIYFLFEYFSLEKITGFVLCEERAYRFWDKLGATFYYVEEEGYIDIYELLDAELQSAFTLILNVKNS